MSLAQETDSVDLRQVGAALRRGAGWIVAGALLGLLLGFAAMRVLRPKYEATATVLMRSGSDGGGGFLARLGGLAGMIPGGGNLGSDLDTELEIMRSRAVIGDVVDELGLQGWLLEPEGKSPGAVFSEMRFAPRLRGGVYRFAREESGYRVTGPNVSQSVQPGGSVRVPGAVLTLRRGALPEEFSVEVLDREDAISRVAAGLTVGSSTSSVAQLTFRAWDAQTAAAVPNALLAEYLVRRRTTDRGVNQDRFEFLVQHSDSIGRELVRAEAELRTYQEATGIVDPEISGRTSLERATALRSQLEEIEAEMSAIERILRQGGGSGLSAQELAAYPSFLKNGAINGILANLLQLQTERVALLQKRTERDDDVLALTNSIRSLEAQLVALSQSYLNGLQKQRAEVTRELQGYRGELAELPQQAEQNLRRQREVKRLAETQLALQAQLVQTRLAAMGEGGEVRPIDRAVPPKGPVFPKPLFALAGGLLGGLFFGTVAAVGSGLLRQRVREPWEAELATGLPAVALDPQHPLSLGSLGDIRTLLLLPVGAAAQPLAVGERLAAAATLQGRAAVLADLTRVTAAAPVRRLMPAPVGAPRHEADAPFPLSELPAAADGYPVYRGHENGNQAANPRTTLEELEQRFSLVVSVLPALEHASTVAVLSPERPAVLVVRAGRVTTTALQDAVRAAQRMGMPIVGVVIQPRKGERVA